MPEKPEHILVIRFSAMGDVAMTVPVLRAFQRQYANVKLTVATKAGFQPLFRDLTNCDVVEADFKSQHKGILGLYKLSRLLNKTSFQSIADLHNVLRTKLLKCFFFGKTMIQIDKGRSEKKALVSGEIFEQLKTTHQRYADVFDKLGFPIDLSHPTFPDPVILNQDMLSTLNHPEQPLVGIAPFAAFRGKAYPLSQMKVVIEELAANYTIVLFGAPGEEAKQLEQLSEAKQNIVSLAGKLDLNKELDVISNLQLMISMDSGNAHLAAMLGVKVLTIWGVTHPYAGFYPFDQDPNNAVLANRKAFPKIPTSVYGNTYPEGYEEVFNSIPPKDITDKAYALLK